MSVWMQVRTQNFSPGGRRMVGPAATYNLRLILKIKF